MSRLSLLMLLLALYNCSANPEKVKDIPASSWPLHIIDSTLYGADGVRAADLNNDQLPDLISGGEEYGATRIFLNQSKLQFEVLEFPSPQVEDALMIDINQDNQMEVLTFSEGKTREITLHYSTPKEVWTSTTIPVSKGFQWMYGASAQIIPDGPMEVIVGSKGNNAVLGWLKTGYDFTHLAEWELIPIAEVGWIMSIEWLDINGDDWNDILISDRKGPQTSVKWYQHPGPDALDQNWKEHILGMQNKEPMFLTVTDWNMDGLEDILVADISEGIFYFEKKSADGKFKPGSLLFPYPEWVGKRGKSVCCVDIDLDGVPEVITSYEEAENAYGMIYSSLNPITNQWKHYPISNKQGIKYDLVLPLDIDDDGDLDLLTTEERENKNGLGVIWYENQN